MGIYAELHPEMILGREAGENLYLVSGRIAGDDNDTAAVVRADSHALAEQLAERVTIEESGLSEEELEEIRREYDIIWVQVTCLWIGKVEQ